MSEKNTTYKIIIERLSDKECAMCGSIAIICITIDNEKVFTCQLEDCIGQVIRDLVL